jgi:pyruvate dehydrogenase E2 component (dihydrolipoamide acetyltransferase)
MATELFIHKMTEHMQTARIVRWLVKEGEPVERGQIVMEVETDKAVAELESPATGVLKGIRPGAVDGAEVEVGETIAFIARADEVVPTLPALGAPPSVAKSAGTPSSLVAPGAEASRKGDVPVDVTTEGGIPGALRATPAARRVAKELGVDLSLVQGTGPEGRIREEDVRTFARRTNNG